MAKLVSTMFVSLDGVYQAPGGPQEDTRGGFEQGGWTFPFYDEDFGRFIGEVFDRADAFLLGRRTYDIFSGYWPKATDPADPVASRLNSLPKYVASGSLTDTAWAGTTVIGGDLAKEITALKERTGGELQLHGSGALLRSLLNLDLVDVRPGGPPGVRRVHPPGQRVAGRHRTHRGPAPPLPAALCRPAVREDAGRQVNFAKTDRT